MARSQQTIIIIRRNYDQIMNKTTEDQNCNKPFSKSNSPGPVSQSETWVCTHLISSLHSHLPAAAPCVTHTNQNKTETRVWSILPVFVVFSASSSSPSEDISWVGGPGHMYVHSVNTMQLYAAQTNAERGLSDWISNVSSMPLRAINACCVFVIWSLSMAGPTRSGQSPGARSKASNRIF